MTKEQLQRKIEDIMLDFARLEVTNSDLQGIAVVEAQKIIELIN